jgi:hypothetical protein
MVYRSFDAYFRNFTTVMNVVLIISLIVQPLIDSTLDTESETCIEITVTHDWSSGMFFV